MTNLNVGFGRTNGFSHLSAWNKQFWIFKKTTVDALIQDKFKIWDDDFLVNVEIIHNRVKISSLNVNKTIFFWGGGVICIKHMYMYQEDILLIEPFKINPQTHD